MPLFLVTLSFFASLYALQAFLSPMNPLTNPSLLAVQAMSEESVACLTASTMRAQQMKSGSRG